MRFTRFAKDTFFSNSVNLLTKQIYKLFNFWFYYKDQIGDNFKISGATLYSASGEVIVSTELFTDPPSPYITSVSKTPLKMMTYDQNDNDVSNECVWSIISDPNSIIIYLLSDGTFELDNQLSATATLLITHVDGPTLEVTIGYQIQK
jgi:hypothetical protein